MSKQKGAVGECVLFEPYGGQIAKFMCKDDERKKQEGDDEKHDELQMRYSKPL